MVGLATPDKTQRVVVVPQHFDDVFPLSIPLRICGWNFLGPVKECIDDRPLVLRWVVRVVIEVLICVCWFPVHTDLYATTYAGCCCV